MLTQRFRIQPAEGTWVVRAGGAVLGESSDALELIDGDKNPVIYFPRDDLGMLFLERSETRFVSPRFGEATYFHIVAKSGPLRDAGWSYEAPSPDAARLAGYIAFDGDGVTVEQI